MSNLLYLVFKCFLWVAVSVATIALVSGFMEAVAYLANWPCRAMSWRAYVFITPFAMMAWADLFWFGAGEKEAG